MQLSGDGAKNGASGALPIRPGFHCSSWYSARWFSSPPRFSTRSYASQNAKQTLLESILPGNRMAWRKWRSNSALIANSIRRRWRNLSFSIIPAVAHEFAWPWIGKRRICRLANRQSRSRLPTRPNVRSPSRLIRQSAQIVSTVWTIPRFARFLRRRSSGGNRSAFPDKH